MNIIYKRLFNLKVGHDYFKDGLAKDIKIWPTRETAQKLNNGKMLFKVVPTGIVVLYKALDDGTTPLVDLGKDQQFTFYLTSEDQGQFFNVTDLDESPSRTFKSSNIVHFKNVPASASIDPNTPEVINHTIIDTLKEQLFTYQYEWAAGPSDLLLRVTDEQGILVSVGKELDGTPLPTTITVTKDTNNNYTQQIDLRNKDNGIYTITIRDVADTTTIREETIYVSNELVSKKTFGILDIVYETTTDHIYDITEEYIIQFSRRESIWKYFVVDKNGRIDLVANDLLITDQGAGGGDPYNVYNFTRDGAEPHATIKVNDLDTVVFKSDLPIPFYEVPKLNLELRKNPGDQQVITNLPNPPHSGVIKDDSGNLSSEIYVFI